MDINSWYIEKFTYTESLYIEKNNLTSQSYPLSEMSRNLLKMKAVPGNTAFCKQLMTMGIPMVLRWFSSFSLTLPKAPTTIGITVALTSHNFCTCNLKSWHMVIFLDPSLDVLISRKAMFMILQSPFSLSMTTISDLRCSISLCAWIEKFQSILHLSFFSTGSGWYENHLSSHSISDFSHRSLLCLFLY